MIPTVLIPALAFIGQIHAAPITPYYVHNISSLADASSHSPACNDIHNCRTLWSIIYSCLATIFACTWVSYHPDIPDRTHTRWRIRVTRLLTVLLAFLVPEVTVAKAASECWKVWKYKSPFQGWTRAHTYFVIMGGFFDSEQPHKTLKAWKILELTADSHPEMFKLGPAPEDPLKDAPPENPPQTWILVTESEIRDKSKGDTLGKLVTVLQTTWFMAQYLGRWTAHQPRTQLEVMTLAYAALNVVIYALWWDKPLDIQEPIDVRRGRIIPVDVRQKRAGSDVIWDAVGSSARGGKDLVGFWLLPVIGVLFGGIHCFAWWFPFPTKREALLWKFCALYCTVGPVAISVFGLFVLAIWGCTSCLSGHIKDVVISWTLILYTIGYIVCRIIFLVLIFTSLRAAGPTIYEATNWTFFFPHFG